MTLIDDKEIGFFLVIRAENRAMRIILKARKRTPIDELQSRLESLSVKQKLVMNALLTVFKMKN
jgi:hypothetical protein